MPVDARSSKCDDYTYTSILPRVLPVRQSTVGVVYCACDARVLYVVVQLLLSPFIVSFETFIPVPTFRRPGSSEVTM